MRTRTRGGLGRLLLRRAALRYAEHGWDVRPGAALRPELAGRTDVVLHGAGSWIPAPPTRAPEGRARWVVSPAEVDWRLPDAEPVQQRILDALPVMWQNAIPAPMRVA